MMATELESDEQIREYVEDELDRTVRARHPELDVRFGGDYPMPALHGESVNINPAGYLQWTISRPGEEWPTFYTVEARPAQREFLIWYGHITHGPWDTNHVMQQAVHLRFTTIERLAKDESLSTHVRDQLLEQAGLGAILEVMLGDRLTWMKDRYPMNRLALT
jgi:hypothetical protein